MSLIKFSRPSGPRKVLGLMSGTSLDGLDLGLFHIEGSGRSAKLKQVAFGFRAYPASLRENIRQAFVGDTRLVCRLNVELGRFFADQSKEFLTSLGPIGQVDLVGMHGQTLFHQPGHSSLQVGEPSFLAQTLQVPVVYDFRAADIAAGGQGAPLVPYLDRLVFQRSNTNLVLQNLGGIGNLTYLPKDPNQPLVAFDTGPANGVLNELAHQLTEGEKAFDQDGLIARQGETDLGLLTQLLQHPYFKTPPPKSTGREAFGAALVNSLRTEHPSLKPEDLMATLCEWVAQSLALSYRLFVPQVEQVILTGGGALNPELVRRIDQALGEIKRVELPKNLGFDPDSKEAAAFALFAHERFNNQPTNLPQVTGAKTAVCLGKIALPT